MKNEIWLIGSGPMAVDYAKVLKGQQVPFIVIGRGEKSAEDFTSKTGIKVITGGLNNFLVSNSKKAQYVIVATGVDALAKTSEILVNYGVKNILCEKPGGVDLKEIEQLSMRANESNSNLLLAYNRRFYASVLKAKEIIQEDGGVVSFNFEFTEWSHIIGGLIKPQQILQNWFLANSTHVVDLAFYLGGNPTELSCFSTGSLDWHKRSSIFSGSGITDLGALFSYQANWESPGRWAVEILTKKHRLYFKPMEKLQIQNIGSVKVDFVEIDDSLDLQYKPGLYKQTEAFLNGNMSNFITIQEQAEMTKIYNQIAGYKD